jgi:hypothetical protein
MCGIAALFSSRRDPGFRQGRPSFSGGTGLLGCETAVRGLEMPRGARSGSPRNSRLWSALSKYFEELFPGDWARQNVQRLRHLEAGSPVSGVWARRGAAGIMKDGPAGEDRLETHL